MSMMIDPAAAAGEAEVVQGYVWPEYEVRRPPVLASQTSVPASEAFPGNFLRSAEWCPDGSCVLTAAEDHTFRLYHFSPDADYASARLPLSPPLTLPQPAPVPAYSFHPFATPSNPPSFAFLASVRSQPVHLVSALNGQVIASYPVVDHRERVIAPWSFAWEPEMGGGRVWCGCEGFLEVFDMERPGLGRRVKVSGTKKGREGQKGILSSLAFSPHHPSLLALASFSRTISLHPTTSPLPPSASSILSLPHAPTQVMFHPSGHTLYALFRAQPRSARECWAWDVRMWGPGREIRMPIGRRAVGAGREAGWAGEGGMQRMSGSVDPGGRWLAAGDERGEVSIFDVRSGWAEDPRPVQIFPAHGDAIGTAAFHPSYPLLLTVSGSRHFDAAPIPDDLWDSDGSSSSSLDGDLTPSPPASVSSGLPELTPSPERWPIELSSDSDEDEDGEGGEGEERGRREAAVQGSQRVIDFGNLVRRSRPRVREARMKIWKFLDVEPEADLGVGSEAAAAGESVLGEAGPSHRGTEGEILGLEVSVVAAEAVVA